MSSPLIEAARQIRAPRRRGRNLKMLNRFSTSIVAMVALLAFSSVAFAQTYGTKGYAPGAWKPDELPKDLAKPKPFDALHLSPCWSVPTRPGLFARHSCEH